MQIMDYINRLEEIVNEAKRVPFSSSIMIKEEVIYEILDGLRQTIPEEVKQARWIVKERQAMIDEAKKEADRIIAEALDKASRLISETEIMKKARLQSEEMLREAENRAREIRLEAEDYADEKLANLQAILQKLLVTVEKGREQLQGKASGQI